MNSWTKLKLLSGIIRWRLAWDKRNTHYRFTVPGNPKFMGPREAIALIKDGDMVTISGLGGNQHATIMYWTILELFEETGHPSDLTVLSIGGQGGRGKVPGTIDELGREGLCTQFITGHMETFKRMLQLGEDGKLKLQCLPQGTLSLLIDAQARGEDSVLVPTGVETFMDPTVGRGTPVAGKDTAQWAEREGDLIRYRMPKIDVSIFNAPAADREGNIYIERCPMIAEIPEMTRAARNNGGTVIANVGEIVEKDEDKIFVRAEDIDAIVQYPKTGQTLARTYKKYWPLITLDSDTPLLEGYEQMRYVNHVLGVTPRRTDVDRVLARLAAKVFVENTWKGVLVNIGTGLPEEVCRQLTESGVIEDITFFTESGVVGGLPGPGIFFGAAACPETMVSSAEIFKRAHRELDVTILGILEVDSEGNVNVSKRGEGPLNYVGPGGFIDFSTSAKVVLFVGSWMAHPKMEIQEGEVRIIERGKPKFIESVDEITFSGQQALKDGRKVFYVTPVGVFSLTRRGLELVRVMPGIDVQKDILDFAPAKIVLPESGEVPTVDASVVTGDGYAIEIARDNPELALTGS